MELLKLAFDLKHLPFQTGPFLFISTTYSHSLLKIFSKGFICTREESIAVQEQNSGAG